MVLLFLSRSNFMTNKQHIQTVITDVTGHRFEWLCYVIFVIIYVLYIGAEVARSYFRAWISHSYMHTLVHGPMNNRMNYSGDLYFIHLCRFYYADVNIHPLIYLSIQHTAVRSQCLCFINATSWIIIHQYNWTDEYENWQGPRRVKLQRCRESRLQPVALGESPTCYNYYTIS